MRNRFGAIGGQVPQPKGRNPVDLIESVLRGEGDPFPRRAGPEFEEGVLRSCALHGVGALLHDRLSTEEASISWPDRVRERLRQLANLQAAAELEVRRELLDVLGRFGDAEVELLLIKGTPMAYLYYPQPYLRTRGDTDIFVPEEQRALAGDLLLRAGYEAAEISSRRIATYQLTYRRKGLAGVDHFIDLHWRLNNSQLYARLLSFRDLYDAAASVRDLGPGVKTPCPVHALAIACMHRLIHRAAPYFVSGVPYLEANRLIWLYDIHLLASRLSQGEWMQLVDLAADKGLRAVCLDGLRVTEGHLGTRIPAWVADRLAAPGPRELAAQYLKPGLWRHKMVDLRALPTWRMRRQLITEWVVPRADYMLTAYGARSRWLLPFLYLRRVPEVARRLFRSPKA